MISIGIDPGLGGALAMIDHAGRLADCSDMPVIASGKGKRKVDPRSFYRLLSRMTHCFDRNEVMVMIERGSAMPKQGVTSMFNFGYSCGMIEGIVSSAGLNYEIVSAQSWKKQAGLIGKEKDASRSLASRLYADAPLDLVKHHGRADAILIARFGYLRHS